MQPIVSWAPISYSSSVAFDTVILILTIAKLNASRATRSNVGSIIYRDSLLYFLLTAVTNITVLIIQALGPGSDLIKPTAVPYSTLITVTMGSRVFLNLKLFNQRQDRINQSLPDHSNASGSAGSDAHRPVFSSRFGPSGSTSPILPRMALQPFDAPFQGYT